MGDIMKYILNEIPVKTTNSFNINNLKIDLDIPKDFTTKEFITKNTQDIEIKYSKSRDFNSNIGLTIPSALNIDINITKSIKKPIEFIYEFTNDNLVDNININCKENVEANIIFKYISKKDNNNFHHVKQIINLSNNSNLIITTVNLLNSNSISLIANESNVSEESTLIQNLIDIGGKIKINNYKSIINKNGKGYLNNIYLGKSNDIIDMNYHYINNGTSSVANIESRGVLNDLAKKNFRGTIDFISGCAKSIGKESEDCILLSDTCVSRSVPILLCGEEDVEGAHSVSSGKIDEEKIFYMRARGIDKEEATKMIILSNFNNILSNINNKRLENELLKIIESKI